jgi:predicted MFS family arabinose efflux permease
MKPLSRRFDDRTLVRAGIAIQVIAFATLAASATIGRGALYAGSALLAVGSGLMGPSAGSFVSKRADPRAIGATLGIREAAACLARMLGAGLGGFLYGAFGPRSPYVTCAIWMGITLLFAMRLGRAGAAAAQH